VPLTWTCLVHKGIVLTYGVILFAQWYRLNDTEARPATVQEVFENAYQLVYSRRALENVVCA
jgi:hypothetical protein